MKAQLVVWKYCIEYKVYEKEGAPFYLKLKIPLRQIVLILGLKIQDTTREEVKNEFVT